ncbi:Rossmann-fold NAD(P)-binding domain-containing protein, partial [Staphylococcus epidermidis]
LLSVHTVHQLKDYHALTTIHFPKLQPQLYPKLDSYPIKQIPQPTPPFHMYHLQLPEQHQIVISNIPTYSPQTIPQYSVSIPLQLLPKFPTIQKPLQPHNFTSPSPIISRPLKNMTLPIIPTAPIPPPTPKIYPPFPPTLLPYHPYPNHSLSFLQYKQTLHHPI